MTLPVRPGEINVTRTFARIIIVAFVFASTFPLHARVEAPLLSVTWLDQQDPAREDARLAVHWRGDAGQPVQVWADLDDDGDWSVDELLVEHATITGPVTIIPVPGVGHRRRANAADGTRFRLAVGSPAMPIASIVLNAEGTWSQLGAFGVADTPRAFAIYQGDLIMAGQFIGIGGGNHRYIARWDGSTWSHLGAGMSTAVHALAVYNGELIAAGTFATAGGVPASRIAKWNGSSWSALGAGIGGTVNALAVYNNELIAAGSFSTAGGAAASRIARWNGSNWAELGAIDGTVHVLAVHDGHLVAGGGFFSADGVSVDRIAKWNGSTWSRFGYVDADIYALAVHEGSLYAGGDFTAAAGATGANYLARWTGTTWAGVGGGVDNVVRVLSVYNGDLIAGGRFGMAGGVTASRIAAWNGGTWSSLGSGIHGGGPTSGIVRSLGNYGTQLTVGGVFSGAGDVSLLSMAAWEGAGSDPIFDNGFE
jgi:hypothetical protein